VNRELNSHFLTNVCKYGLKRQCRYLAIDDNEGGTCLKLTKYREEIDKEVMLFLKDNIITNLPLGDNCPGCPAPLNIKLDSSCTKT
jgi:hypothetical protein